MTTASNHIEEIFWEASQLAPGDQRESYLDCVCGADAELRQRVEKLLRVQPKLQEFLEQPFAGPAPAADLPSLSEGPGSLIGPYKLLEQIGEGGMGLVFMAEQLQPLRRRVALKVLKPGMDTKQVVARFEAERQALALMDHPNIAHIHDAGTTATGRPYFAMELVRGVPITEFCDQRRLTPRQRLELFVTVCQAVQHAHQKGIIHRDLKPSNVLVTLHDTVAVPKVIDFGIAKATHQPLTERTLFTHLAQMVGTPLYMSPEQAEMNSLDVDTRSDVYSLGVLLYAMLTGTTPFESTKLKHVGLDELRRIIREEEPPQPSQRVSTLGAEACTTASERRGVDGRRLRQLLQGELDWIVMKALEKDRNRRYESATALAADVQCYLQDEPVAACPPTAGYRLRKFARRHRRGLLTAGILAVALVAATVVSSWQALRAWQALCQAEAAESRATTEAAIATAVNDFLQEDLLGQADAAPQNGEDSAGNPYLTVREALDRASARIGQRFQDQPLVEAAIRAAIGQSYRSLSRHRLAVPHMERAVALSEAHLGPDHPKTLARMEGLANDYSWVGRHTEAIALRQWILEYRKAVFGTDHPDTLACVVQLAGAYQCAGQLDTSMQLVEPVLEKQRAIYGPTHPITFGTMRFLAMNYAHVGRLAESIAMHEKVLDGLRSTYGPEHASTIGPMMHFAQVCQRAGELDRADRLLREALALIEKGQTSGAWRLRRANALGWLALNMHLNQRYAEAESLIRETLAHHEVEYPDSPRTFYWKSVLGVILLDQQRYAEAEPLILEGYEGIKQREVTDHLDRIELTEAGERVVRFYEVTNQPEKASAWRDKLGSSNSS